MSEVRRDACAVLFPATEGTTISAEVAALLKGGGCSFLIGESRQEYLAREMSKERLAAETPETFLALAQQARALAGNVILAVDQEVGGICRLQGLVPDFPSRDSLSELTTEELQEAFSHVSSAARALGLNCFLAPVLDVVTGENPWLRGRTLGDNPSEVARIAAAYVKGARNGGVAATPKHFPGFHDIALDPAEEKDAIVVSQAGAFEAGFEPFRKAIAAGAEIVMVGPAITQTFDADNAAALSPEIYRMLRQDFGFKGVAMSDDLDAPATCRDLSVPEAAVAALTAGADLLMLADVGDQLSRTVDAICYAVADNKLDRERLGEAAQRVRKLAEKYS